MEYLQTLFLAGSIDRFSQDGFGARLVPLRVEVETHRRIFLERIGRVDTPSRKDFRDLRNILLGVATVHAQRVQLH